MSKISTDSKFAIVIHGGAGTIARSELTAEKEAAIRATLRESVMAGYQALVAGASSTERSLPPST